VDGTILVSGDGLKTGELIEARIVDYCDYDLLAEKI
jgi:hypothetical protein